MHRPRLLLLLLPALALAATAASAPAPEPAERARAELAAALRDYERWTLHMAGDSLAAMYAPDGELLREDGSSLRGPAAIAAFLNGFHGVRVDSAALALEDTQCLGDDAVQWGTFAQVVTVEGRGVVHARGRFVLQWRRQPDGAWRLRRVLTQSFPR